MTSMVDFISEVLCCTQGVIWDVPYKLVSYNKEIAFPSKMEFLVSLPLIYSKYLHVVGRV